MVAISRYCTCGGDYIGGSARSDITEGAAMKGMSGRACSDDGCANKTTPPGRLSLVTCSLTRPGCGSGTIIQRFEWEIDGVVLEKNRRVSDWWGDLWGYFSLQLYVY